MSGRGRGRGRGGGRTALPPSVASAQSFSNSVAANIGSSGPSLIYPVSPSSRLANRSHLSLAALTTESQRSHGRRFSCHQLPRGISKVYEGLALLFDQQDKW